VATGIGLAAALADGVFSIFGVDLDAMSTTLHGRPTELK
jgi:hypothetical protein